MELDEKARQHGSRISERLLSNELCDKPGLNTSLALGVPSEEVLSSLKMNVRLSCKC